MKRSKLVKFLLPLTLGILFFSFASTVHATGDASKITIRPLIPDWTLNNPAVFYSWGGYPSGSDQPLYLISFSCSDCVWAGAPDPFPIPFPPIPDVDPCGDCANPLWYDGYIKEKTLSDGRAELTVYINFQDWMMESCIAFGFGPIFEEGFTMSGQKITKFILPAPSLEIPWLPSILMGIEEGEMVFESITATGYGTFTVDAGVFGFTPTATGKVTVIERTLYWAAEKNEYRAPWTQGIFPVEVINIIEMPN